MKPLILVFVLINSVASIAQNTDINGPEIINAQALIENRPDSTCGDADEGAEDALRRVIQNDQVIAYLKDSNIKIPTYAEFILPDELECARFRKKAEAELFAHEIQQQSTLARGETPGAETFVYEFFKLDNHGFAVVKLQSSAAYEQSLEQDGELHAIWFGRGNSIEIQDARGERILLVDDTGRILAEGPE